MMFYLVNVVATNIDIRKTVFMTLFLLIFCTHFKLYSFFIILNSAHVSQLRNMLKKETL